MGAAGSTSNSEYFGPPSVMLLIPSITPDGITQRRPSATSANSWSNREGCCAEPRKPLDGGGLTKVALLSPVDEALIFSGVDRGSIHGIDPTRSEFTRGTLNVPEV